MKWRGFYTEARFLRQGDGYLLVEFAFEHNVFSSLKAMKFWELVEKEKIPGIIYGDEVVESRGVSIRFDGNLTSVNDLVNSLKAIETKIPAIEKIEVLSRRIRIPVWFDDKFTRECQDYYSKNIKKIDSYDTELLVKYNGLRDFKELQDAVVSQQWWGYCCGFQCGICACVPTDPRYYVLAPKYNPPRTWTHEGTVSIGYDELAIYPLRGPGGYRQIGITPQPIYVYAHGYKPPDQIHPAFTKRPVLHYAGDRIELFSINEEEYQAIERAWEEGKYYYKIYPFEIFSSKKYMEFLEDSVPEAQNSLKKRPWAKDGSTVKILGLPWEDSDT